MSRVVVYNLAGTPIAEIRAAVDREWLRNEVGEGSMTLSRSDVAEDVLRFGNRVVVYGDHLPVWGGYIDPPMEWDNQGHVKVSLYSAVGMLAWRRTPDKLKLRGTPGARYWQLLELANTRRSLGIVAGDIDYDGEAVTEELETEDVLEALQKLAEETGYTFWLTPSVGSQTLQWRAHWRLTQNGVNLTHRYHLRSGHNIMPGAYPYVLDGEIVNDLLAMGRVDGKRSKTESTAIDEASISLYDVREGIRDVDSNYDGKLSEAASVMIRDLAYPTQTVDALIPRNLVSDATLEILRDLALDNVYTISMGEVGFGGLQAAVRLKGFGYNDISGQARLILEVL